jgi:hypothetical protein
MPAALRLLGTHRITQSMGSIIVLDHKILWRWGAKLRRVPQDVKSIFAQPDDTLLPA